MLKAGDKILNATTGKTERVGRLLMMHANNREDVTEVYSGDIAVAIGLKNATTGDTLCDPDKAVLLENISFAPPVVHVAIEPASRPDQEKLAVALAYLVREDPSLQMRTDEETGQTVLSGMGELHLEVTVERLKREYKVNANTGARRSPTARRSPPRRRRSRASSSSRRAARASTASSTSTSSRTPARASSSSRRSRAATSRRSTSRRSARAASSAWAPASSPATRWRTSR
jgi:peptide subunit release factor RF-3